MIPSLPSKKAFRKCNGCNYDAKDRKKAEMISREFLKRREAELKAGKRNIPTQKGHTKASYPSPD